MKDRLPIPPATQPAIETNLNKSKRYLNRIRLFIGGSVAKTLALMLGCRIFRFGRQSSRAYVGAATRREQQFSSRPPAGAHDFCVCARERERERERVHLLI